MRIGKISQLLRFSPAKATLRICRNDTRVTSSLAYTKAVWFAEATGAPKDRQSFAHTEIGSVRKKPSSTARMLVLDAT